MEKANKTKEDDEWVCSDDEEQKVDKSNMSFEDIQMNKKMMRGFTNMNDESNMLCKRIRKDAKFSDPRYEDISLKYGFNSFMPAHKASKFASKKPKRLPSKKFSDKGDESIFESEEGAEKLVLVGVTIHPEVTEPKEKRGTEIPLIRVPFNMVSKMYFLGRKDI